MAGEARAGAFSLPEKAQMIVSAGINLFELRKTQPFSYAQRDFGFWNVRAYEDTMPGTFRLRYRTVWFTGQNAYIEFTPNQRDICTAFCPDDHLWHNRITLAATIDEGSYTIELYHTSDGFIPGRKLVREILIIRDYMQAYKVMDDRNKKLRKEVYRSKSRDEAISFANEWAEKNSSAVPSVIPCKIKELEELIKKHGGAWIQCPEFQAIHRPKIQDLINQVQAKEPATAVQVGASLLTQVSMLSEEEKRELASMLAPHITSEPKATGEIAPEKLSDLSWNDLRRLAKIKGVNVKEKDRAAIEKEIEEKVAAEKTQATDHTVSQPPTPDVSPYEGMEQEEIDEAQEVVT